MSRASFTAGRLVLGLLVILLGLSIFTTGYHVYDKPLHELRKVFFPDSNAAQKAFGLNITFEQLN